jgi:membrane-bound lytic murein transglycosylase D
VQNLRLTPKLDEKERFAKASINICSGLYITLHKKYNCNLKEYALTKLQFFSVNTLIFFIFFGCSHTNALKTAHKYPIGIEKTTPDNTASKIVTPPAKKFSVFNLRNNKNIKNDTQDTQDTDPQDTDAIDTTQQYLDEALDYCQVSQDFWQKGEVEHAVEALDQAYTLILNVNTCEDPELIQQKEDLRFMISKRILEIYASRNIVLNGNHDAIPMIMNKHVQEEIDSFTKNSENRFFIEAYKRSGKYREKIVEEFTKAGIPVELSWLPLIESGFKSNALSKARALGLWQFIPSTGYKFGLKRDLYIDERLDPDKSTAAAIAYLKELHNIFGDWSTVLAAYNCGEGRVLKVIRNQNVNYLDDFWDLYQHLPSETAKYVPRFIATLHIVNNPELYGLNASDLEEPLVYESIDVSKKIHLKDIADTIDVSRDVLKELNPELRYEILPGDTYELKVPFGKKEILLASIDGIPVSSPPIPTKPKLKPIPVYASHKIRKGETLATIAKRYHTSEKNIAKANHLDKNKFIVAGKTLKIPLNGTHVPDIMQNVKVKMQNVNVKQCKGSTHVVKKGDSLGIIAGKNSTTTKKIMAHNHLTSTDLYIGQVLKIPADTNKNNKKNSLEIYKVKSGDTPFTISKAFNVPLEKLLRLNQLTPGTKIYPGQKLYVE